MGSSTSMLGRIRRCTKRLRTWMGEERAGAGGDVIFGEEAHAAVSNLPRQLFDVLFPGEGAFTLDKAGALAARLRREAAALDRVDRVDRVGAGVERVGRADVATADVATADVATQLSAATTQRSSQNSKEKREKSMDFRKYQRRYVALDVAYRGFDYHGFARSDHAEKTIEEALFAAMRRTKLVEEGVGWRALGYSRGGRTDKGVSGAGQVVALGLRSRGLVGEAVVGEREEYDYCQMLNSVMSEDVRVVVCSILSFGVGVGGGREGGRPPSSLTRIHR